MTIIMRCGCVGRVSVRANTITVNKIRSRIFTSFHIKLEHVCSVNAYDAIINIFLLRVHSFFHLFFFSRTIFSALRLNEKKKSKRTEHESLCLLCVALPLLLPIVCTEFPFVGAWFLFEDFVFFFFSRCQRYFLALFIWCDATFFFFFHLCTFNRSFFFHPCTQFERSFYRFFTAYFNVGIKRFSFILDHFFFVRIYIRTHEHTHTHKMAVRLVNKTRNSQKIIVKFIVLMTSLLRLFAYRVSFFFLVRTYVSL